MLKMIRIIYSSVQLLKCLLKKRDEIYSDLENFLISESPDHHLAQILISILTNSPSVYVPIHLQPVTTLLMRFGHRNLWHGILPQSLSELIFYFGHNRRRVVVNRMENTFRWDITKEKI
jgi:hypothetical protein